MSKRRSMSVLSASQANTRSSMSLVSDGAPHSTLKSSAARKSLGGGGGASRSASRDRDSGVRRSGAFMKGSSVRSDPRPLGDKAFQQACIRSLIGFLTANGYDHAVSPKLLASPTAKEFMHIVQFLFRKVDPNVRFAAKPEEDVPGLFKRLGYPFQISKSALSAVGSPHTWPGLLAALTWLVELLTYDATAEDSRNQAFDSENGQRVFFEYVGQSYGFFLSGDDEACGQLDEELASTFATRDEEAVAGIDQLEAANAALQEEIEALKATPSPVLELQKTKADLGVDLDKFSKLIGSLQSHKTTLQRKVAERQVELDSKQAELRSVTAVNDALRERVATQEVNTADVEHMAKEKAHLDEMLDAVSAQKDKEEKVVWDREMEAEKKVLELEEALREYHSKAAALQLIPRTAKRANGMQYEIVLNAAAAAAGDMLTVDMKGTIKPGLMALKEEYAGRSRALAEESEAVRDARHASQEAVAERIAARDTAEAAMVLAEETYKRERERMDTVLNKATEEADELEADVLNMKGALKDHLADKEAELSELQREILTKLDGEKPRNSLDMRGRLDSKGERYGEVIKFKDSELRFVEMFDELCSEMSSYTLSNPTDQQPEREWVKASDRARTKGNTKALNKAHSRDLINYCSALVEEHEEDLIGLIREEAHRDAPLGDLLCNVITKPCKSKAKAPKGKAKATLGATEEIKIEL